MANRTAGIGRPPTWRRARLPASARRRTASERRSLTRNRTNGRPPRSAAGQRDRTTGSAEKRATAPAQTSTNERRSERSKDRLIGRPPQRQPPHLPRGGAACPPNPPPTEPGPAKRGPALLVVA